MNGLGGREGREKDTAGVNCHFFLVKEAGRSVMNGGHGTLGGQSLMVKAVVGVPEV